MNLGPATPLPKHKSYGAKNLQLFTRVKPKLKIKLQFEKN